MVTQAVLQTDVYTDFQGLNALRSRAHADANNEKTLREVAGQFEALFLQMMLKSMRDASLGEGLLDNEHTKTYQSMFDKQIAIKMTQGRGIGLAEMMVRQLSRQGDNHAVPETDVRSPLSRQDGAHVGSETDALSPLPVRQVFHAVKPAAAGLAPTVSAETAAVDRGHRPNWKPDSPRDFVHELWPHAKRAADELGTRPELLIAQAALETGWGQNMIHATDGHNSFNLFGIKADAGWKGPRATTATIEFKDGLMRKERATFRAYPSPAESFKDYTAFLKTNPRYRQALDQAADAPAFVRALAAAGYATDPDYHTKIQQIMDSPRLRDAVSSITEPLPWQ